MGMHPLNEEQLKLLNEYKSSGQTVNEFASKKHISSYAITYLINKERRLNDEMTVKSTNNRFISVPLINERIKPEVYEDTSNDVIVFSINDLNFKMNARNLRKFMEAIK